MSQAGDVKQQPEKIEKSAESEFTRKLQQYFPKIKPDSVRPSPVKGLYEVIIGPRVYYLSQDARYLVPANIIDLQAGINLTKPRMQMARLNALEGIGEDNMITFSPAKPEYIITVFTDIDCAYCRKMHSQIEDYNKLGIAIRYLFYPRAGMGSESYKTAMSVWCNKDRKKAFTDAKAGKKITFKACDNPISTHMKLVQQMELRGTPALLLPSGELIESYIPPAELLKLLR
jgi:thiol:disulfide interchange protein DsbC